MPILEFSDGRAIYEPPKVQGCFPTHACPSVIGDAIREVSRTLNLPVELPAQAALGAVSLVAQNFISVQCPNYAPAPCSLFLMAVSDSSAGKSPAEERFLRALKEFERKQEENVAASMPIYRAALKDWKDDDLRLSREYRNAEADSDEARSIRKKRRLHEQNRPVEPVVREFRYGELSPQGLRDALVTNGAVGIFSPEAGPVINGMTFSQPALLSGYWSGEDRPVGLVSGKRRPAAPQVTIAVMCQQDTFSDYMKSRAKDAFGTGLLARMLVTAPQCNDMSEQETCIQDVPEPKLELFNKEVTRILSQAVPAPRDRAVKELSARAKFYWKLYKDAITAELSRDWSKEIKWFFRKLAQQASRIAALFHYFEGKSGDVSQEAMKGAIALCEWYTFEYVRIFEPYAPSEGQKSAAAAEKLLEWLRDVDEGRLSYRNLKVGEYSVRDLRNYSVFRSDHPKLQVAINILRQKGHIAVIHGKKGGEVIIYPAFGRGQQHSFQQLLPHIQSTVNPTSLTWCRSTPEEWESGQLGSAKSVGRYW